MADYEVLCGISEDNNRYAYISVRPPLPQEVVELVISHLEETRHLVTDITTSADDVTELEATHANGYTKNYIPFLRDQVVNIIKFAGYDVIQNYHTVSVDGMENLFDQNERQKTTAN